MSRTQTIFRDFSRVHGATRITARNFSGFHSTNCSCCGGLLCLSALDRFTSGRTDKFLPNKRSLFSSSEADRSWNRKMEKDSHVEEILQNNREWVGNMKNQDPAFFDKLGEKQIKPKYLYYGCSDARVPANQILGLGLELFR